MQNQPSNRRVGSALRGAGLPLRFAWGRCDEGEDRPRNRRRLPSARRLRRSTGDHAGRPAALRTPDPSRWRLRIGKRSGIKTSGPADVAPLAAAAQESGVPERLAAQPSAHPSWQVGATIDVTGLPGHEATVGSAKRRNHAGNFVWRPSTAQQRLVNLLGLRARGRRGCVSSASVVVASSAPWRTAALLTGTSKRPKCSTAQSIRRLRVFLVRYIGQTPDGAAAGGAATRSDLPGMKCRPI